MRRVILETPFAGNRVDEYGEPITTYVDYARRCMMDCLERGEAPMASHLLYTQVLDDRDHEQRRLGLDAGHAWREVAEAVVVYSDYLVSGGMREGIQRAESLGIPVEYRSIVWAPEVVH